MEKDESALNKQINLFLFVITFVFACLHFWVVFVLTAGFTLDFNYLLGLSFIFSVGVFLIPVGFKISHVVPKSKWYFLTWAGYIWMGTFFISLSLSTLYFIFDSYLVPNLIHPAFVLGLIFLVSVWALKKGLTDPVVRSHKINVNQSIGSLKIVQITDLHVGLLAHNKEWVERIVKKINQLDADLVFLTGDLVEGKWSQVFPMIQPISLVKAKLGKVFVSGNHEFIHGGLMWENSLKEMGWTILHNENIIYENFGKKILVAGVPDRMVKRFDSRLHSHPDKALKTRHDVDYKILLAHEPASVWDLTEEIPHLLLSGHTHGGQIFPFNGLVRLVQPVVSGWKTIKGVRVFAHEGTGLWGPPMRLGSESQIVLLEILGLKES